MQSDDELLQALTALAEELGRPPTQAAMQGQGEYPPELYLERFDSWEEVLKAAGLTQQPRHPPFRGDSRVDDDLLDRIESLLESNETQQFFKGKLMAELLRLAIDLDKTPSIQDMERFGEYSAAPYQNHFGSWNAAVKEIGLEPNSGPYTD